MSRTPVIFNEARMRAMMDRKGLDLVIVRGVENSRYISEFFHNGGNLGYRPFCVFYFRDPAKKPAFVVPAVDLHLAMTLTWIEDVRAYAMAEATAVLPYDYLRLPVVTLAGFLAFGELPDQWTFAGAGVIALSSIYIARREALVKRSQGVAGRSAIGDGAPKHPAPGLKRGKAP